jgi:hypothetical protein
MTVVKKCLVEGCFRRRYQMTGLRQATMCAQHLAERAPAILNKGEHEWEKELEKSTTVPKKVGVGTLTTR